MKPTWLTPPRDRGKKTRRLAILGATGSIGRSTLDVVRNQPDDFEIVSLVAGKNMTVLAEQVGEFSPPLVAVQDESARRQLDQLLCANKPRPHPEILVGEEGIILAACMPEVDMVVSALVGFTGLVPTHAAIQTGKDIALANKETLVAAGAIITNAAKNHNVRLLPIDSEHNAVFQCLQGDAMRDVRRLILTASGGPFFRMSPGDFRDITPAMALQHPTWSMGQKVTIDSATMMNKGLEVMEARWLFDIPAERIDVIVHPQSAVHALVEFCDGAILAHLSVPDMRQPIRHVLNYPQRECRGYRRLDLLQLSNLEFLPPDMTRFPCLSLAYHALKEGGCHPAILNAANEVAVHAFLEERLRFSGIPEVVAATLEAIPPTTLVDLEQLHAINHSARKVAEDEVRKRNI